MSRRMVTQLTEKLLYRSNWPSLGYFNDTVLLHKTKQPAISLIRPSGFYLQSRFKKKKTVKRLDYNPLKVIRVFP